MTLFENNYLHPLNNHDKNRAFPVVVFGIIQDYFHCPNCSDDARTDGRMSENKLFEDCAKYTPLYTMTKTWQKTRRF